MRRFTSAALLAAALVAAPQHTEAQVAVDSVEVQIYAPGDIEVLISPRTFRGFVGDTLTFTAVAIDGPTGDTIDVLVNWSTPNPAAIEIDAETGHATFLTRGTWRIRVEVERLGDIVMFQLSSGGNVLPLPDTLRMQVGELVQLCAYVTNLAGTIVARSSTMCPLPGESPAWAFTKPSLLRSGHRVG